MLSLLSLMCNKSALTDILARVHTQVKPASKVRKLRRWQAWFGKIRVNFQHGAASQRRYRGGDSELGSIRLFFDFYYVIVACLWALLYLHSGMLPVQLSANRPYTHYTDNSENETPDVRWWAQRRFLRRHCICVRWLTDDYELIQYVSLCIHLMRSSVSSVWLTCG